MEIRSEAFGPNRVIPTKYTCEGEDISPPLFWSKGPDKTRSYLVLCEDEGGPDGTVRYWGVYDIPADETSLIEDLPPRTEDEGIKQAENDFNTIGYEGPCPPRGDGAHQYRFKVWALKVSSLEFDVTPSIADLKRMARPHVAAQAELIGLFERG